MGIRPIDHRGDGKPGKCAGLHAHHDAIARMTRNMTTNESKQFLLIGTRSQLGKALLPLLAERGDLVIAVAQQQIASSPGIQWVPGRMPEIPAPQTKLDAIISFGPMDKLAEWLERMTTAPAARVVATSSMSAVSKQAARFAEDRAISLQLQAGESRLRSECSRLGMPCVILRPTMIYGLGVDQNLSQVAKNALKQGIFVAPQSNGLRQPVHAADVAEAALRAANIVPALEITVEIGGGERLSVREMFARVHASLPRKTLYVPTPNFLLSILAAVSKKYRGAVSRLDADLIADNAALEAVLGIRPRSFRPDQDTWRNI